MQIYGLKTCDTTRKAMRALRQAGHAPVLVDVAAEDIGDTLRAEFARTFGAAIINRRSTTWRGLDAAERELEPEALMAAHPAVMKRPVIRGANGLTLGWDAEVQGKLLGT